MGWLERWLWLSWSVQLVGFKVAQQYDHKLFSFMGGWYVYCSLAVGCPAWSHYLLSPQPVGCMYWMAVPSVYLACTKLSAKFQFIIDNSSTTVFVGEHVITANVGSIF